MLYKHDLGQNRKPRLRTESFKFISSHIIFLGKRSKNLAQRVVFTNYTESDIYTLYLSGWNHREKQTTSRFILDLFVCIGKMSPKPTLDLLHKCLTSVKFWCKTTLISCWSISNLQYRRLSRYIQTEAACKETIVLISRTQLKWISLQTL